MDVVEIIKTIKTEGQPLWESACRGMVLEIIILFFLTGVLVVSGESCRRWGKRHGEEIGFFIMGLCWGLAFLCFSFAVWDIVAFDLAVYKSFLPTGY